MFSYFKPAAKPPAIQASALEKMPLDLLFSIFEFIDVKTIKDLIFINKNFTSCLDKFFVKNKLNKTEVICLGYLDEIKQWSATLNSFAVASLEESHANKKLGYLIFVMLLLLSGLGLMNSAMNNFEEAKFLNHDINDVNNSILGTHDFIQSHCPTIYSKSPSVYWADEYHPYAFQYNDYLLKANCKPGKDNFMHKEVKEFNYTWDDTIKTRDALSTEIHLALTQCNYESETLQTAHQGIYLFVKSELKTYRYFIDDPLIFLGRIYVSPERDGPQDLQRRPVHLLVSPGVLEKINCEIPAILPRFQACDNNAFLFYLSSCQRLENLKDLHANAKTAYWVKSAFALIVGMSGVFAALLPRFHLLDNSNQYSETEIKNKLKKTPVKNFKNKINKNESLRAFAFFVTHYSHPEKSALQVTKDINSKAGSGLTI